MKTHSLFTRSKHNPILSPEGSEWRKIYNPGAALDEEGNVHLFPRVLKKERDWHSRIAHVVSADGEHFAWNDDLALVREGAKEKRGVEDPRVTRIGDTYFMTYAAFDGKEVVLHSARAKSLGGPWQKQGPMVPDFNYAKLCGRSYKWVNGKPVEKKEAKKGKHWSKSGALFPELIDGKYVLLFGDLDIWIATSTDGITFTVEEKPFLAARTGTHYFDNIFIETGPPPILTEKGWLVLYHGIDEVFRYQLGFVLLDRHDLRKILYRSDEPIFSPQEEYEIGDALIDVIDGGMEKMNDMSDEELKEYYRKVRNENLIPQVVFSPGAVVKDGILHLYYGAGDTSICTASAPMDEILKLTIQ